MRRFLTACSALMLLSACARDRPDSTVIVRDSAGVEIVESRRPLWDSAATWRVADTPSLSIGALEGRADQQFAQIVGATRFDDSSVVVADAGSNSVRFFGHDGRLIRRVGRSGRGPGEYQAMQGMRRSDGEALEILDRRQNRVTVLDRSGAVRRIMQLPTRYVAMHRLSGDRWLASAEEGHFGGMVREDAAPGVHRFPAAVVLVDSNGVLVDTVGVFPGAEMAYLHVDGRPGSVAAAYGGVLSLAGRDGKAYVTTGEHFGFDVYGLGGRHVRSVRAMGPDRTLRPGDLEEYRATILAEIPDAATRERFGEFLRAAAAPEQKAAVSRILVDPLGHVWLSAYDNSIRVAASWYVFDPDGRYLGEIGVPSGLRIMEIGARYVLGVWRDDAGVEFVRVHALDR